MPRDRAYPTSTCPHLTDDLAQLLSAPDRSAYAAQRHLYLREGRVLAHVLLRDREVAGDVAQQYGVRLWDLSDFPDMRFTPRFSGMIPVDRLCRLACDPRVSSVALPTPAHPS